MGIAYAIERDGVWKVPQLRPYETRAVKALQSALPVSQRVVAVGPTGCGKTVIGAALMHKLSGRRVLWLAHRIELLKQAGEHLQRAGVPSGELGVAAGGHKANTEARILVGSIDTIRGMRPGKRDLIVVDEAHRVMSNSYAGVLEQYPDAWVLGFTATPWRLDGKPLGDTFKALVPIAEPAELIADGYLTSPVVYGVPREKAREMVAGLRAQRGDFSAQATEKMAMRLLMGDIVQECARLAPEQRTLVFATSRKHGKALARAFVASGRRFKYLDGETPGAERSGMLSELRAGDIDGIVNVDVLSEGFDCPEVKCVALARPTRSLTRYLQQCGRASRPYGDSRTVILDHAGNSWRFGLPSTSREWLLEDAANGDRTGEAPVMHCKACGCLMPLGVLQCPECGADSPRAEREQEELQSQLQVIEAAKRERRATLERLREVAASRGVDAAWVTMVMGAVYGS